MKFLKIIGLVAATAMAVLAVTAASASATTVEVGGVTKNSSTTITVTVRPGDRVVLKDTSGFSKNECGHSHLHVESSSPFTGSSVTGPVSALSFSECTRPVTVHAKGSIEITYTSGTNGTVASEGAEVTVGSAIGTLTCKTGATTSVGTLTGVAAGNATIDVNAVLNCGIIPSAKWEGAYGVVTAGIGVSA